MHRYIRGLMLAGAAGVLWGCGDDPLAEGAGDITKLAATPSALYINQGDTEAIIVEAFDAAGTAREASFSLTSVSGAGIDVALDESYVPAYDKDGNLLPPSSPTRVRFQIAGNVLGDYSFTVTAAGRTITVPVRVIADEVAATFEPANPAPGDTVTLTMPAGLFLTPDAGVAFTGHLAPIIVDRAPDGSSLRLIAAPTTSSPATITGVVNTAFPDLPPFTLTTTTPLVSTMAGVLGTELPATFSDVTPGSDPVVMTANPGFGFLPNATITFPAQTAPIIQGFSTDSTQMTFLVGPNVDTTATVTRIFFLGAPQFVYTRTSEEKLVSPVIASMPIVMSDETPEPGQTITVTAAAGFKFRPNATVTFGGRPAGVQAISADSSTVTLLPMPGVTGSGTWSNVLSTDYLLFPLVLPGSGDAVAVPDAAPAVPHVGTGASATAPIFDGPLAVGNQIAIVDAYPNLNQYYKFEAQQAGKYRVQLWWQDGDAACVSDVDLATSLGNAGTCAHPEQTTATPAVTAAGATVTMLAAVYAVPSQPAWLTLIVTRLPD